ncbi:hypothetical protein [Actimicrobium sp. CCI2.3]|uniref:hypothetical protein n=1 Tax=Actimicrobium sp. CCI2.3 TaxID=3048616 RepID=UPI002AB58A9E|nr:hypothetical protein [Actimicrobium sp. CCI2.3]MDY7576010.1 hypothetical protein [Actimicrobium sp. CCI2.3]MEB0023323.1 hypothetical protein [Actimicrobium sp. CCI2.3]
MSAPKKPADQTVEQVEPKAIYQRFTFLHDAIQHNTEAMFAEKTMNICQGISTCIDLIHSSETDRDNGTPPILGANAIDRLLRFVVASADMLAIDAEKCIHRVDKEGKP